MHHTEAIDQVRHILSWPPNRQVSEPLCDEAKVHREPRQYPPIECPRFLVVPVQCGLLTRHGARLAVEELRFLLKDLRIN